MPDAGEYEGLEDTKYFVDPFQLSLVATSACDDSAGAAEDSHGTVSSASIKQQSVHQEDDLLEPEELEVAIQAR